MSIQEIREITEQLNLQFSEEYIMQTPVLARTIKFLSALEAEQAERDKKIDDLNAEIERLKLSFGLSDDRVLWLESYLEKIQKSAPRGSDVDILCVEALDNLVGATSPQNADSGDAVNVKGASAIPSAAVSEQGRIDSQQIIINLWAELAAANEKAEKLAKPVRDFLDIVNESRGIDGWHRNGDILLWEQCEQIAEIEDALASVQKPEEGKE
jgi:predicted RNase H-like nuclease (RuvC/YqgF family)